MTAAERIQAVVDYGFTERQARFLVLVMRHSGLCVKRQYAAFAGIANGGEKCNTFFAKLVRRGFAIDTACIHNRARLYHVHHKPLYHAIGEADGRYRRTVPARGAAHRLMRLDMVLPTPDLEWLTTTPEKVAWLRSGTASNGYDELSLGAIHQRVDLPNPLPGTFPIGIDRAGRVVLFYLATLPWTDDFRTWLVAHATMLGTPTWTLRVVFPQPLRRVVATYETVVREELESPLPADAISDLARYFFHRRRGTDPTAAPESIRAFLIQCGEVFGGPRFTQLYRRWLAEGDAALTPVSATITNALASGRARVECDVLPHAYEHVAPLITDCHSKTRRARMREERGDETSRSVNPVLNPVS